jgi:hypothetical protein
VLGSIFARTLVILTKDFCGFLHSLHAYFKITPQLSHNHFLPNPFQYISHRVMQRYIVQTSGSQPMGHNPKLGCRECSHGLQIYYQNHFIFHLFKRSLIKLINAKVCEKETDIRISLHVTSLSCSYLLWCSGGQMSFSE